MLRRLSFVFPLILLSVLTPAADAPTEESRVLQYLPQDFPTRPRYIELLQKMAGKVPILHDEDGLWRASLLDPEDIPLPETSGSSFFTYAIACGINNGVLDRERFTPVVKRAWRGLVSKVTPEGRLTHVQQVGASPEQYSAKSTHEYAVGAFLLAASEVLKLFPGGAEAADDEAKAIRIDFGDGPVEEGYIGVDLHQPFDAQRGFGWTSALDDTVLRDRGAPGPLRRDYIFGRSAQTFRITVVPGTRYMVMVIMGDMEYGNHVLQPKLDLNNLDLPELTAEAGQFATLRFGVDVPAGKHEVNFTFTSPVNNWVINSLTVEPAANEALVQPEVSKQRFAMPAPKDTWSDEVIHSPDPIAPLVKQFRADLAGGAQSVEPSGIERSDYLELIAGNIDHFKALQDERGAIIDPHRKEEFQYSTPCFAYAAATLVAHAGREDLLEPAARAFDWASSQLAKSAAANNHDDFYAPPLARAYPLLKDRVEPERARKWAEDLEGFDPLETYSYPPGANNWNVVALSGEYQFSKLGFRKSAEYVETSVRAQGRHFSNFGMYTEGPMAYDHFPRLWAADLIAAGYDGARSQELGEILRRAALTSLFMQSPTGELPTGGRSAHHQWNEAQQVVTYEIYAARALKDGDAQLTGVFKRAAHRAFKSMQRWQRDSGEMWIVKNKFEPGKFHGYESYSSHSQYNLLPMAMLAMAYEHAATTEDTEEVITPAEVGGFVLDLREIFHKVIANAGGMYIEIDTTGDMEHNPTGLLRVHQAGFNPQLGPSDGISAQTVERYPQKPTETVAIGPAWQDVEGKWRRLAEFGSKDLSRVELLGVEASPQRVTFQLIYQGYFSGLNSVSERYIVAPDRVTITTELPGYTGPARLEWPVLSQHGEDIETAIDMHGKTVSISLAGETQTYTVPDSTRLSVSDKRQPHRNGYVRVVTADFAPGTHRLTLVIEPKPTK